MLVVIEIWTAASLLTAMVVGSVLSAGRRRDHVPSRRPAAPRAGEPEAWVAPPSSEAVTART